MAATRALRADAQRNRDRLLEVAVRVLSQAGPDVPLEAIAKEAGVGIGTLYRHFPSREALVDAAYRNELDRLADAVDDLLRDLPPDRALRGWMDRFVDYLAAKRGMGDALRALIASGGDPFAHSRDRLTTAVGTLLRAGAAAGTLRADVASDDILVSLSALSLASADRGDREQAGRLLDLLMDALRVRA
ncbi:TetR/AcrR family transcriptional regulator [Frankia sp. AgB1.9]|uniref:TetR/AcrR family transcriptional regulator n=1 Tax=unclassified Frankia TaxID=2632575 RepID=UPI001931A9D3|nr:MULTISPECIES: TetR/AcrR family transcriptional regulator [unclassified Frankia]MBL7492148.1 TetR/AcrR family transcriptional regulator [Frankia sp. AgW1.1]MBL7547859.1 TetR/AcrR family transcriptional regulator [Frankia sp. AgB1.9]MBL7621417.1 TetR/AcrR family transcriptional regulator [Frankia sp. AgB1.8]